jgi:hypothetical protein
MTREKPSPLRQGLRRGACAAIVFTLAQILPVGNALAQDAGADRFTLRGFGTLGATTHDTDGIEFRRNVSQGQGAEADEIDLETDSLAGLQIKAALAPRLDFTLQGVTRLNAEGNWAPRITQAFLRYSPDESLVLRAGRFGYEIYLLAESRQVGYSYLAVRPSQDFYGLVTNDEADGVDASWTTRFGPGIFKVRAFGGKSSDETALPDGTSWEGRSDILGATLDYSYRSLTARLAMLRVSYGANEELRGLGQFLASTGVPQSVSIGDDLAGSSQESQGLQLGFAYDDGPLQAQLLYGHIISDSIAGPNVDAFQAQVGYRVKRVTPFLAFAKSQDRHPIRSTGLPGTPELQPIIATVQLMQEYMRATQHTTSVGLRWDFAANWAMKAQADFARLKDSVLNFDHRGPEAGAADLTVLTATLDFVF